MSNKKYFFSDKENDTLIACYADTPTATLAEWFDKPIAAIYRQAVRLGVKKSIAFLSTAAAGRYNSSSNYENSKRSQFKKGQTPPNKGKKQTEYMSAEAIANSAKTRFKKGQTPHNTYVQESGIVIIRKNKKGIPYQFVKLARAKWLHLHIYVWQQAYGIVPKGLLVTFKDGNTMNCVLENLELIDRAENMRRNSHIKLPADVQAVIHAKAAVTRQLNQINQTK